MIHIPSRRRARLVILATSSLILLSACAQRFDYDLRKLGGGAPTDTTTSVQTLSRPQPDNRGIISYPNYQVAVADRGDTIETMATRLGLDAPTLARFNGIEENAQLRSGEVIALPSRVAEPSVQTGAVASGTTAPGSVDIGALAGGAIERADSNASTSGSDVRVAALPAAPTATVAPVVTEPVRHKVARGETAYTISRRYDVPVKSLAEWNGLDSDFAIREGQYLLIPVAQRAAPVSSNDSVPKPGVGSPTPTPPSAATPLPEASTVVLAEPEPPIDVGERSEPSDDARMLFPVTGSIIREYAKGRNDGINIQAAAGTAVKSADAGTVAAITKSAEGIPIIVIRHEPELLTVYANVTDVSVSKGTRVARGQEIASLRDGDDAFVHFEVRQGFDSVDPMPYLR